MNDSGLAIFEAECLLALADGRYSTSLPSLREEHISRWVSRLSVDAKGCWLWGSGRTSKGYGRINFGGVNTLATRLFYTLFLKREIGTLFVCHRCDTPPCVNPAHLFLGTARDNWDDCVSKGRAPARRKKDACPQGHPYTEENSMVGNWRGRQCRACNRAKAAAVRQRMKTQIRGVAP